MCDYCLYRLDLRFAGLNLLCSSGLRLPFQNISCLCKISILFLKEILLLKNVGNSAIRNILALP